MENKIIKTSEGINIEQEGTATHSGWMQFYSAYSKYRDECIRLGKNVLGNNINIAIGSLSEYYSALYSMAQQVFSFYNEETETQLTTDWLDLGDKVNDFLSKVGDRDFRHQMEIEGYNAIDRELKVAMLKYFNKVDRMAAESGLQVGREDKGNIEPKKGLIGFGKR